MDQRPPRSTAATQPVACPACGKGQVRSLVADAPTAMILVHHADGTMCSVPAPALSVFRRD